MAYTKTSLISSPVESSYGLAGWLDGPTELVNTAMKSSGQKAPEPSAWDKALGAGTSILNFFGQKEETKQERAKRDAAAAAAAAAAKGGAAAAPAIPTTYLVVGGLAVAGLLVFAMRRK